MTEDDRVSVQTYVPSEQRERWKRDADEMNMSQAEFVRTMVQAGRRGFELGGGPDDSVDAGSGGVTRGVDGLKPRVLDVLRAEEFADWETLLAGVTDDIEERLEDVLDELQSEDRIRYSGRRGGYTVRDDEH